MEMGPSEKDASHLQSPSSPFRSRTRYQMERKAIEVAESCSVMVRIRCSCLFPLIRCSWQPPLVQHPLYLLVFILISSPQTRIQWQGPQREKVWGARVFSVQHFLLFFEPFTVFLMQDPFLSCSEIDKIYSQSPCHLQHFVFTYSLSVQRLALPPFLQVGVCVKTSWLALMVHFFTLEWLPSHVWTFYYFMPFMTFERYTCTLPLGSNIGVHCGSICARRSHQPPFFMPGKCFFQDEGLSQKVPHPQIRLPVSWR